VNGPALSFVDIGEAAGFAPDEPLAIGSEAHKTLLCRTLLDTFNPYRPAVLDWPKLDAGARERLISLPIWDIAVQTEGKAGPRVKTYAEQIADPLLARAIALNAFEERRHGHVLSNLVHGYGITLAPELVETFEPVMQEEGRHILFFVDWAAWRSRNLPWWRKLWFALRRLGVWAFLIWERLSLARDVNGDTQDNNLTVTGANQVGVDVRLPELLEICLAANSRRLGVYDARLLRQRLVPALVRFARRFMGGTKRFAAA